LRRVTCQCRAAKVRVLRQKIRRRGVQVSEVAAPAAGDADFFADAGSMVHQHDRQSTLPSTRGAEHARRARTDDDNIDGEHLVAQKIAFVVRKADQLGVLRFIVDKVGADFGDPALA
jgi:hypothetical protein